jgi:hypothetical protein
MTSCEARCSSGRSGIPKSRRQLCCEGLEERGDRAIRVAAGRGNEADAWPRRPRQLQHEAVEGRRPVRHEPAASHRHHLPRHEAESRFARAARLRVSTARRMGRRTLSRGNALLPAAPSSPSPRALAIEGYRRGSYSPTGALREKRRQNGPAATVALPLCAVIPAAHGDKRVRTVPLPEAAPSQKEIHRAGGAFVHPTR